MEEKFKLSIFFVMAITVGFVGCKEFEADTSSSSSTHMMSTRSGGDITDYYWYKGERVPLQKVQDKTFILFKSVNVAKVTSSLTTKGIKRDDSAITTLSYAGTDMSGTGVMIFADCQWTTVTDITPLSASSEIIYSAPHFQNLAGEDVGLTNLFYVKLKNASDKTKLETLANENAVDIIGKNIFMPLWYTLACSNASNCNALEMANVFYETGTFAASEPDLRTLKLTSNDQHYSNQWNLENTGQYGGMAGTDIHFADAMNITQGTKETVVAVIDEGVQLDHPDLPVYSVSWDAINSSSPSILRGNHGTRCAGIIGATTNNTIGVAGIASNVSIMSISNAFKQAASFQTLANSIYFAADNGAAVISNSWAGNEASAMLDDAITYALSNGRGGKGCVLVFSTGNEDVEGVLYPANSNPDVIAVGAMNQWAQRKSGLSRDGDMTWGSNYGPSLDIVAPGVKTPTTDVGGLYMTTFGQTSAACPHVAAVAALMLSINPNLTQKEVVDMIEQTATKAGVYAYATTTGRPNGMWHKEVGYGLLNALDALIMAAPQIINYANKVVTTDDIVTGIEINAENVVVSNGAKLTFKAANININKPFTVEVGCQIEFSN